MISKRSSKNIFNFFIFGLFIFLGACDKTQSYSELLRDEEEAVNWYLSGQNVILEMPDDPKDLITSKEAGDNAPFYKLDADGYVYMKVISAEYNDMVDEGDLVYFRFTRENINTMYAGIEQIPAGNADYMGYGPTSFVYKNTTLSSTTTWGTGIQMPLKYLGYNSEVTLVLRSYYGFLDEQSSCVPYLINLRYFKPEY